MCQHTPNVNEQAYMSLWMYISANTVKVFHKFTGMIYSCFQKMLFRPFWRPCFDIYYANAYCAYVWLGYVTERNGTAW